MPDSQEYLHILQISITATPPPQPNQVQMSPELEQMDIDIPEHLPDLLDVPEELLSDFDSLAHSVLDYQW